LVIAALVCRQSGHIRRHGKELSWATMSSWRMSPIWELWAEGGKGTCPTRTTAGRCRVWLPYGP
jgi:hypothetical protein